LLLPDLVPVRLLLCELGGILEVYLTRHGMETLLS
jgi:hypothetical protein